MTATADIFTVRTSQGTVLIGPVSALGQAYGGAGFDSAPTMALHLQMALDSCRDIHALRQFCRRGGLQTHDLSYVDNVGIRTWLVDAVMLGQLGVVLLPDVQFTADAVHGQAVETKKRIAARIDNATLGQGGAALTRDPAKLIEALQDAGAAAPTTAGGGPARQQPGGLTPAEVLLMAVEDRILEVIKQVLASPDLPVSLKQDLKSLFDPQPLSGTVAVLTAWAVSEAGELDSLTDLTLLALGEDKLDGQPALGLKNLARALNCTRTASIPADLQEAARALARAIALIGIPDLNRLIARSASLPISIPLKTSVRTRKLQYRAKPPRHGGDMTT